MSKEMKYIIFNIVLFTMIIALSVFNIHFSKLENYKEEVKAELINKNIKELRESRLNYMLSSIRLSEICDRFQSSSNLKDNDSLYLHLIDKIN